ncbi:MAG: hypothetical protein V3R99_11950 [Thermoguttaceae bacterium]
MLRSTYLCCVRSRGIRWCGIAAAVACLGLSSCTNLATYREDAFRDLDPRDYTRQVDPADRHTGYFGVDPRAQQIDRNFGPGL